MRTVRPCAQAAGSGAVLGTRKAVGSAEKAGLGHAAACVLAGWAGAFLNCPVDKEGFSRRAH